MNNYEYVSSMLPDERECIRLLDMIRWNGIVTSPFDSNSRVYVCGPQKYKCKNSGKYFNPKTKTIFHNSKISLRKWFTGILIYMESGEINSVTLSQLLNISQKSAWLMLTKIHGYYSQVAGDIIPNVNDIDVTVEINKMPLTYWLRSIQKK